MGEAAANVTTDGGTATTTNTTTPSAGQALSTNQPPDWAAQFNDDLKSYVANKNLKSVEHVVQSYRELEKKFSSRPPEDRTIIIPEKLEGDNVRPIFEKLGAPKAAKDYELPKVDGAPETFQEWASSTFHKNSLTKTQAEGVIKSYNDYVKSEMQNQMEAKVNSLKQADAALQKEWGAQYEANINLAKQGAKILGLDGKTLDQIESLQGREALFKTLQKIGVAVGESQFVDGKPANTDTKLTPEQANAEIQALMGDKKFGKAIRRGDREALKRWNELHEMASPGEFKH